MIQVDISNIWGEVSLPDLLAVEKETAYAHEMLMEGTGAGREFLGWLKLPMALSDEEVKRIQTTAEKIRKDSDVCVVIGDGWNHLGSRAAIELLQGIHHNVGKGKGNPQIFFAGNSLSTRQWNELCRLLEGKDISLIVISKSGTTTESAIAFRGLRWMLERKYGTDEANARIYAVTDGTGGALRQMAKEAQWEIFPIPADIRGGFAVLSSAGLLPMAVAGIDIAQMIKGAGEAAEEYDLRSFENPVWLYASVRNLLYRRGKGIELLESCEPGFHAMGCWWQQLMGESEGKDGKGIFPAAAELHALDQMILEGERNLFETVVRFDPPEQVMVIGEDVKDLEEVNYLSGKTLDFVDEMAYQAAVEAHVDGGVSVISVECGALNAHTLGQLFYFYQLSCGISAYIMGVNPFDRPAVEAYLKNMHNLLGKPGDENE